MPPLSHIDLIGFICDTFLAKNSHQNSKSLLFDFLRTFSFSCKIFGINGEEILKIAQKLTRHFFKGLIRDD